MVVVLCLRIAELESPSSVLSSAQSGATSLARSSISRSSTGVGVHKSVDFVAPSSRCEGVRTQRS
eukprot:5779647-Alexandrium_andersonii.AAC.1